MSTTRFSFGGGAADFVVYTAAGGGLSAAPATTVTFWTAQTGGTQVTDLLNAASAPITSVTSNADGSLPVFKGPADGTTVLWASVAAGAERVRLVAADLTSYLNGTYLPSGGDNFATAGLGSAPLGSLLDVDSVVASNASGPLALDNGLGGTQEVVEPSVYFNPNGWNGYRWWKVAGPYDNSSNAVEQPTIWKSNDNFVTSTRVYTFPAPPSGNYDDPHLAERDGVLYVVWNYSRAANSDQVLMSSTTDGATWTTPAAIRTSGDSSNHEYVSPHVEWFGGKWHMWTLSLLGGTRAIYYSNATTLTGTWAAPTLCTAPLPSGFDHWEFEVRRVGSEWWMLQCLVNSGGTASGGRLYWRTSQDGITWNLAARPMLTGTGGGSDFDGNFIYKASFVPYQNGKIGVWYSAGSGGTLRWKIGYTTARVMYDPSPLKTARWYVPLANNTTGLMSADREYAVPFFFSRRTRLDRVGVGVTVGGSVGSVIRLGIRADGGAGEPGALLLDVGTQDGTAVSDVAASTVDQWVGPGVVWFTATGQGSPATQPTVRMTNSPTPVPISGGAANDVSATTASGFGATGTTGALPATYTVTNRQNNVPRIHFRVLAVQ